MAAVNPSSVTLRRFLLLSAVAARRAPRCVQAGPQVRHATTGDFGTILGEPTRETRFGLLKVFLTVLAGLTIGANISKNMAAFLEENELFVPEDDDDDDD